MLFDAYEFKVLFLYVTHMYCSHFNPLVVPNLVYILLKVNDELGEASIYTPIISIRLENIDMLSIITYQHRVNQLNIQVSILI